MMLSDILLGRLVVCCSHLQ